MDLSKMKAGDYAIAGAAFLFLISMFLPWYGASGYNENGLDYFFFGMFPLLLIIAVVVLAVLNDFTDTDMPDIPVPWSLAYVILGGFAAFLVLIKIVIGSSYGGGVLFDGFDLDRKFGIFIAFLAAGGVAAGGVLKLLEDGGIDQLKGGGFGSGGFGPPPGPPQGPPPQGPPQGPPPSGPQPF